MVKPELNSKASLIKSISGKKATSVLNYRESKEIIDNLNKYWADYGCVIRQPYDLEKGAATMSPATFFGVLGPKPLKVAYIDPVRRPTDGRYGENPNRLFHYFQYQVILKPSPIDVQDRYLDSLRSLGIDPAEHDVSGTKRPVMAAQFSGSTYDEARGH